MQQSKINHCRDSRRVPYAWDGRNSWKNREVGVNNQVGLVAGNAMVCAKKTAVGEMETKKWFSESLLVAAY